MKSRIWICNQRLNLKNRFQRWEMCLWIFFLPFFGKSEKGFEKKKTVYKQCSRTCTHIISRKKNTVSWEQFCKSFFTFQLNDKEGKQYYTSILRTKFSEVKPLFRFSIRLQNPKSGFQNLNPGFDVTLLLLSPSWLIFLLQHRAVRQLKSNTAQQLEVETKKMEERIRALKEQMFKEKEERE